MGDNAMRIAICDDEKADLEALHTILKQYDQSSHFQIDCYVSAVKLLEASHKTQYDIAILDIEMKSPNGYDVALRLRQSIVPPLIIFVTNSNEYTTLGYGVAFRYIKKPLTLEILRPNLDAAIRDIRANRFTFSVDGISYVLSMQEIYYIEVYNHVTTLHTMDGEYSLRTTLKELLAELPQGYFGMPHQSYIVNFSHVRTASPQEVVLTNGTRLPVSRRRQADFIRQLHSYLGR
jgi:DNA-binding LytR/AlgR family response regulator